MKKLLISVFAIGLVAAGCNTTTEPAPAAKTNSQQTPTPTLSSVKVSLIALNDNGKLGTKIGCNDSAVYITKSVAATTQPLNAAFKSLFAINTLNVKDAAYKDPLYNVIYKMQSTSTPLKFDHATLENGVAKIYLTGSTGGLGGVCDSPRVRAQIDTTAKQFASVTSVQTYLNNTQIDWTKFDSQK